MMMMKKNLVKIKIKMMERMKKRKKMCKSQAGSVYIKMSSCGMISKVQIKWI